MTAALTQSSNVFVLYLNVYNITNITVSILPLSLALSTVDTNLNGPISGILGDLRLRV